MTTFTVYSRVGCHLCEVMIEELLPLIRNRAEIAIVDIDADPATREKYDIRVPVLAIGEQEICQYQLERDAVEAALGQADQSA